MIRFFLILRKIVITLAPLALLYFLRQKGTKTIDRKSSFPDFDKSKIVDGEIVE